MSTLSCTSIEISPRDESSLKGLPGLSWKHSLRDLQGGTVEQVFLTTKEVVIETNEEHMTRSCRAEPKPDREERFESQ